MYPHLITQYYSTKLGFHTKRL